MLAEGFLSGINNMSNPVAGVLVAALFSASPMTPPPMQPSGIQLSGAEFVVAGEASRSCGEYIQAIKAEQAAQPPDAVPGIRYTALYAVFAAVTDGFLTGINYVDRDSTQLGQASDAQTRMTWLEGYCKTNPKAAFVEALEYLRIELIKKGT